MDTQLIDQEGLGYITQYFSKIGCSLNEYKRDIGIDAIIEIREKEYTSSGKFIAIQLKSGNSFFKNETEDYYYLYMDNNHIEYWLKCLMPVLFIIYSPSEKQAFWHKIDKESLSRKKKSYKIKIPKDNRLSTTSKHELLQFFYGKIYSTKNEFKKIHDDLRNLRDDQSINISINGFEVFINGLMDMCLQLYFHTDIINELLSIKSSDIGGYVFPELIFFEKYFEIINFHNLLFGSFSFELEMMRNKKMLPQFIKPLSQNGSKFLSYLPFKGFELHDRIIVNMSNCHFIPYIEDS